MFMINCNETSCRPIRSVIILVINKLFITLINCSPIILHKLLLILVLTERELFLRYDFSG